MRSIFYDSTIIFQAVVHIAESFHIPTPAHDYAHAQSHSNALYDIDIRLRYAILPVASDLSQSRSQHEK